MAEPHVSHTQKRKPALGVTRKGREDYMRGVLIRFDEDTFAEIRARAIAAGTSFAQQVRELVEWGLEAKPGASNG